MRRRVITTGTGSGKPGMEIPVTRDHTSCMLPALVSGRTNTLFQFVLMVVFTVLILKNVPRKLQIHKLQYSNTPMGKCWCLIPGAVIRTQRQPTISLSVIFSTERKGTWNLQAAGKHSANGKKNLSQAQD